jgi:hypothetical protein
MVGSQGLKWPRDVPKNLLSVSTHKRMGQRAGGQSQFHAAVAAKSEAVKRRMKEGECSESQTSYARRHGHSRATPTIVVGRKNIQGK